MKNILFITYQYPPFGGSHSTRTLNIANKLSEEFNVYVITSKVSENLWYYDKSLSSKIDNRIKVIEVEMGILHRKYNERSKKKYIPKRRNNEVKAKVIDISKSIKERILIPDPVIDWYPNAIKAANKIINEIEFDYIISSATPYTNHLIAYRAAKINNIPLILDYGDPWVFEKSRKRGFIRRNIEKIIERNIINYSEKVFVTTNETKKAYKEFYNIQNEKIEVVRMGFDYNDFDYSQREKRGEYISLIYGGTLNEIHRNPIPFFESLTLLEDKYKSKIKFNLYCDNEEKYKLLVKDMELNGVVNVYGFIPNNDFMKELQKSDILVLFGNSCSLQIPGKLYNYLGSLTNIFLINNHNTIDETTEIIKSIEGNFYSSNEKENIKNQLIKIIDLWEKNTLNVIKKESIDKYSWDSQLNNINKMILEGRKHV